MDRVAVVGPGGAGKSTFSRALGEVIGAPVVHLDQEYWRPGWVETPREEWHDRQRQLVLGDRWVIDGNYGGSYDVRFERADTVIVLQPHRLVCLVGVLRRWLGNLGRAVQAEGCPERVTPDFLRWVWRYQRDTRPRLDAALARQAGRLTVVQLRSRGEAARFLRTLGLRRGNVH